MRRFLFLLALISACGGDAVVGPTGSSGTAAGGSAGTTSMGGMGGTGGVATGGGGGGTPSGTPSGVDCNPAGVACDAPPMICPPGEVPSVENGCWGPCVPILECATQSSCDGCPTPFCFAYTGFVTDFRCVAASPMCAGLTCDCLAEWACADPYDICDDTGGDITCICPSC